MTPGVTIDLSVKDKYGPNMRKLFSEFIARETIPTGTKNGLADAVEFFTNENRRNQVLLKAKSGMENAIAAIKSAPDNPYGDDDEVIAGILLEKIKERRNEQKSSGGGRE